QVINMSLGGGGACSSNPTYQSAINDAVAAGTTVVVAAGNNNADASNYSPASCNGVITVAATNRDGSRAYYSNYGSVVEISAPGGAQSYANDPNGVLSTLNTGTQGPVADSYEYYQGTSMAAPHVAGIVSLLYSANPALTPAQVLSTLQSTVTAFPGGSTCTTLLCGSGIINAGAAVAAVSNVAPAAPVLASISNPDGDGNYTVDWNDVGNTDSYILQEDDNSSFSSPTPIYTGAASQYAVTGKADGTWYYRVQAHNSYGDSAWSSWKSVFVGSTRNIYLPLILRQIPPPAGPTAGLWEGFGMEFYVTPDRANVDNFAIWVDVPSCGVTLKITRTSPLNPITNDQFAFTGSYYASGTFNSATTASGLTGLYNYLSSYCGMYLTGGPWAWDATWSNSSQPTIMQVEATPVIMEAVLPSVSTFEAYQLEP
ncbi:MAG TPA: hypothetical protein DEH22_16865, partial [Chloroflexi bacterium]|nr:hypothetical protein [Chloroflexota bacterium]